MDSAALDITLGRIRQIENRISIMDRQFGRVIGANQPNQKSFNNVLNKEIQKDQSSENVKKTDITLPNTNKNQTVGQLIEKYSKENGLNEDLVNAVIKTESGFNRYAVSHAGAQGLMQLMPQTAQKLGVEDPFDPEQNISGGTKYLSKMINRYNSIELGLAAYNAGPEAVDKYSGIPPYKETQNYVKKIMGMQNN